MVFSSAVFLFGFLPITLLFYFLAPGKAKNYVLLVFSLIFYAWGGPAFTLVLLAVVAVDYVGALLVDRALTAKEMAAQPAPRHLSSGMAKPQKGSAGSAKLILVIVIAVNLAILCYYKYTGFFIEQCNAIFGTSIADPGIILPIGISFYTFQSMSYVVDVYRRQVDVQRNPLMLLLYVSMFPQLIAGPIVRYKDIAEELKARTITWEGIAYGCERFILGLAKKLIIANQVGALADTIYAIPAAELTAPVAWLGAFAYMLQIYFDFSAYSDMAIGLGRMMGFHFLENFDYPYISKSITEFWRRWHMSLGQWFRDYVYIPLGGNRKGLARQLLNIAIVWALTGFWHGATWNFILWGLYYAIFLVIEKCVLLKFWDKVPSFIRIIYALVIVFFGWVLFRCESLAACGTMFSTLFAFGTGTSAAWAAVLEYLQSYWPFLILGVVFALPIYPKIRKAIENTKSENLRLVWRIIGYVVLLAIFFVCLVFLAQGLYNPFIYFRF